MSSQQAAQEFDVIIIGGGPAGYTAALYAARAGLHTAVLERQYPMGQMVQTNLIENYPGFPEGIDGYSLAEKMRKGAEKFGAQVLYTQAQRLELTEGRNLVYTGNGPLAGKTLIYAAGAYPRKLGLQGEDTLLGKGIHYCATCDGAFYRGKTVAVVGGGNSAVEDALFLSGLAGKVLLIHRRDTLRAARVEADRLKEKKNVEFHWDSEVSSLQGSDRLLGLTLRGTKDHAQYDIPCDALFVSIGRVPETGLVSGLLTLDEGGYIVADESTRTNIPSVFAAGDVRRKPLRQVITAAADGAVAAQAAAAFLDRA